MPSAFPPLADVGPPQNRRDALVTAPRRVNRAPAWPLGVRDAVVDRLAALVLADLDAHPFGSLPTDTGTPPTRSRRPGMTTELRATIRKLLGDWQGLLRSTPTKARPILRELLVGRLVLTPTQLPIGRFYEFTGTATYGALLSGVVAGLVPPG